VPGAICPGVCSTADATTIQSWYNSFCNGPVPQENVVLVTQTSSSATATRTSGAATTAPNGQVGFVDNGPHKTWLEGHYGWVIFVVLLFVFMITGFVVGLWFRKRHARKEEARLAALTAGNPSAVFSTHSRPMSTVEPPMTAAAGTAGSRHSIISRSRTGTVSSFQSPVVWGPHQHQAHTHGYEYPQAPATPAHSHPVPTPVYSPRFSRERLSSIAGDDVDGAYAPRTPVGHGHSRVGTPHSIHKNREHVESRFIEGDATTSMTSLPDTETDGHGLNKKQSRKLSKRG
jgi:hypothetical protein